MEIELVTALSAFVGGRVYPDFAPENVAKPFCTYQQVGGTPIQYLEGGSGTGLARMQINVWAATRAESVTLMRQIEQAVASAPLFAAIEGGAISQSEPDLFLYGQQQDFTFQYQATPFTP